MSHPRTVSFSAPSSVRKNPSEVPTLAQKYIKPRTRTSLVLSPVYIALTSILSAPACFVGDKGQGQVLPDVSGLTCEEVKALENGCCFDSDCVADEVCNASQEGQPGWCVDPSLTSAEGYSDSDTQNSMMDMEIGPDAATCEVGDQGCDCYGNDTCNDDLVCDQGICVEPEACDAYLFTSNDPVALTSFYGILDAEMACENDAFEAGLPSGWTPLLADTSTPAIHGDLSNLVDSTRFCLVTGEFVATLGNMKSLTDLQNPIYTGADGFVIDPIEGPSNLGREYALAIGTEDLDQPGSNDANCYGWSGGGNAIVGDASEVDGLKWKNDYTPACESSLEVVFACVREGSL